MKLTKWKNGDCDIIGHEKLKQKVCGSASNPPFPLWMFPRDRSVSENRKEPHGQKKT